MNYDNYKTKICKKYKVHLIGWPAGLKFGSMSKIGGTDDLSLLNKALICGDCRWAKMTEAEVKELEAELNAAGPPPPRQKRRDAGKRRKGKMVEETSDEDEPSESESDEGRARPKKKARRSRGRKAKDMLPPKSSEYVQDSDEGEAEDQGVDGA